MPTVQPFPAGGYRFINHQFQYSGGVAAEPGFRIERARFARPVPLAEGFDAIEAYLAGIGRSPTAFCACELRSPAQFTDAGFVAFNRHYVERLAAWGIFRDEVNPVARSNVCPEIDPPTTPSFYAFRYTVPSESRTTRSFVAAGSGEARKGSNRSPIVKRHLMLIGRAASRGAFKGAALVGAFAIIVATWWWDASLLTAAADTNLQLIKIVTQKWPFDWGSKVESGLRIFGA